MRHRWRNRESSVTVVCAARVVFARAFTARRSGTATPGRERAHLSILVLPQQRIQRYGCFALRESCLPARSRQRVAHLLCVIVGATENPASRLFALRESCLPGRSRPGVAVPLLLVRNITSNYNADVARLLRDCRVCSATRRVSCTPAVCARRRSSSGSTLSCRRTLSLTVSSRICCTTSCRVPSSRTRPCRCSS